MGLTQHAGHACLVNDGGVQGGGRGLCGAFATVVLQARDDSVLKTPPPPEEGGSRPHHRRGSMKPCVQGFPLKDRSALIWEPVGILSTARHPMAVLSWEACWSLSLVTSNELWTAVDSPATGSAGL